MITKLKIGTRKSKLAVWQANYAKNKLEGLGLNCEIESPNTIVPFPFRIKLI